MLGGGHQCARPQGVAALVAGHLRHRHARAEVGIFTRALDDAAPARITRDVDHGREGPVQSRRGGFLGGDARGALLRLGRPARRHREWHGKNRPISVHHVHGKQQRDAEPRFLDRHFLQFRQRFGAGDMQVRAHTTSPDAGKFGIVETGIEGFAAAAGSLHQLAELFLQSHLLE
jgi:hypothetical protein